MIKIVMKSPCRIRIYLFFGGRYVEIREYSKLSKTLLFNDFIDSQDFNFDLYKKLPGFFYWSIRYYETDNKNRLRRQAF